MAGRFMWLFLASCSRSASSGAEGRDCTQKAEGGPTCLFALSSRSFCVKDGGIAGACSVPGACGYLSYPSLPSSPVPLSMIHCVCISTRGYTYFVCPVSFFITTHRINFKSARRFYSNVQILFRGIQIWIKRDKALHNPHAREMDEGGG